MSNQLQCMQIEWGTPYYDWTIDLRTRVLRDPLNLVFYVEDLRAEHDQHHWICMDGHGQLLACLIMKELDHETYQMRQVAVDPSLQGSGIGTFLVDQVEHWAVGQRKKEIILHARDVSIPFYLKNGYQAKGAPYMEVGIKHLNMIKEL